MLKAKLKIENGDTIECLFNPKDYTVTKTNNWKAEAKQGASAAKPSYTGGNPWEMTLQLMFDSSLLKPTVTVKQITQTLFDAMNATLGEGAGTGGKKNTKRPPTVKFEYGWFSFVAVIKNLSVQYTLFTPDGEPIRADVKIDAQAGARPRRSRPTAPRRARTRRRARRPASASTSSTTATRCQRSPTAPTATRRAGA